MTNNGIKQVTLRCILLIRRSKAIIYKTIVRLVLMETCETWTVAVLPRRFERNALREKYGIMMRKKILGRVPTESWKNYTTVLILFRLLWTGYLQRSQNLRWYVKKHYTDKTTVQNKTEMKK